MLCVSSALALLIAFQAPQQTTDSLDRVIRREMGRREIPGLSIAIVDSGRIVFARGYGMTKRGGSAVTDQTLFQAGSISKPVTAVAAMRLVSRGVLKLDRDVNEQLVSWKLRDTSVADGEKVTARMLMSHSAGLNVHGFPGYALTEPLPTAVQVLNGGKPVNTPAVRIEQKPGAQWSYSGGGYTILQVLMSDVAKRPFADLMQEEVLTPAGMTASTYAQPLPATHATRAATGHYADGSEVVGGWHSYPEMAAAGLWTTASDLARFAIAFQNAYRRMPDGIVTADIAGQMLSYQRNDFQGLGFALRGNNRRMEFAHNGRDEGFDASFSATAATRQAVVIMINANDNSGAVERIRKVVATLYGWPNERPAPLPPRAVSVSAQQLASVAGRYEMRNNRMAAFEVFDGQLMLMVDGKPDDEFVVTGADDVTRVDGVVTIHFLRDSAGKVTGFESRDEGGTRRIPRVGPIATTITPTADPDRKRTATFDALLRAMAAGKAADHRAMLAPGALRQFSGQVVPDLVGVSAVRYLGEEDVSGRGIERHGGRVARIVYLGVMIAKNSRVVLVHLTGEGLVTDYDVVVR